MRQEYNCYHYHHWYDCSIIIIITRLLSFLFLPSLFPVQQISVSDMKQYFFLVTFTFNQVFPSESTTKRMVTDLEVFGLNSIRTRRSVQS